MSERDGVREQEGTTAGDAKIPSAGLTELGQIAVTVEDVERATAFYRDVLGVPFLVRSRPRACVLRPRRCAADAEQTGGCGAILLATVLPDG